MLDRCSGGNVQILHPSGRLSLMSFSQYMYVFGEHYLLLHIMGIASSPQKKRSHSDEFALPCEAIYHFSPLFPYVLWIQSSSYLSLRVALSWPIHFGNEIVWIPEGRRPLTRQLTHSWTTGWLTREDSLNEQMRSQKPSGHVLSTALRATFLTSQPGTHPAVGSGLTVARTPTVKSILQLLR